MNQEARSAAMSLCAVVGCENKAVEIGTMEADAGLIARFPICVEHRDYAVREGIAGRRWELLLSHDRYTVKSVAQVTIDDVLPQLIGAAVLSVASARSIADLDECYEFRIVTDKGELLAYSTNNEGIAMEWNPRCVEIAAKSKSPVGRGL